MLVGCERHILAAMCCGPKHACARSTVIVSALMSMHHVRCLQVLPAPGVICCGVCRYLFAAELPRGGKGSLTGYTGLIWGGFRPSDDGQVKEKGVIDHHDLGAAGSVAGAGSCVG